MFDPSRGVQWRGEGCSSQLRCHLQKRDNNKNDMDLAVVAGLEERATILVCWSDCSANDGEV